MPYYYIFLVINDYKYRKYFSQIYFLGWKNNIYFKINLKKMIYRSNTPNYKTNRVDKYDDFMSAKKREKKGEELKDLANSFSKNTDESGRIPKNTKLRYNDKTRKMDDVSKDIVLDELGYNLNESVTEMNIANMSRFIKDYKTTHGPFENRGLEEGISVIRKSDSMHAAIVNINKKIEKWKSGEMGKNMKKEEVDGIINGLLDLANHVRTSVHD
jgi:hypothetical protein